MISNINIDAVCSIAQLAGDAIMKIYQEKDFSNITDFKADNSPLTLADKNAHEVIVHGLQTLYPAIPIISEEGENIEHDIRKDWKIYWLIDPLDGTKEFIKRNGEFTVNIALVHKDTPILGVVAVPVSHEVYYAAEGYGAYLRKEGKDNKLPILKSIDLHQEGLRVVASRSHMNEETEKFINQLSIPSLVSAGSSLKFMLLASGQADVYPRYAPTMEWDTAAAHAVVKETGRDVFQYGTNQPLVYNKENLLNPYFLVI